ncbi:unnamed protein product [Cylindrotheca closterium]|uniref:Helicase-associated domain-containing protein n=1 Tax=Cylindrotheca closterium TaxID=2856 RepID=A0AAD2FVN0_9STRA|nr:unnamed protein product [Cylindrotheca closterium]
MPSNLTNESRSDFDHSRHDKYSTTAVENSKSSQNGPSLNQPMCASGDSGENASSSHPFPGFSLLQYMSEDITAPGIKDPFRGRSSVDTSQHLLNHELFMLESAIAITSPSTPDGNCSTDLFNVISNTLDTPFPAHAFEPTPIGPFVRISSPVQSSDETRFEVIGSAIPALISDCSLDGSQGHREISVSSPTPSLPTSHGSLEESTRSGSSMTDYKRNFHFMDANVNESPKKRSKRNPSKDKAPLYRPYQEVQWAEKFQELLNFKAQNGHCLVQHTSQGGQECDSGLSRWVKRQRYQYKLKQEKKPSALSDERVQQLEEVGFVWYSHAVIWEERRLELEQYRLQHGHCNVPSQYPEKPKLASWVKCQRRQYQRFCKGARSSMTAERFGKLDKMGFTWQVRGKKNSDSLEF